MAVLSDASILATLRAGTLKITPFSRDGLQPATYDMRLHWKILLSPSRYEKGRIIDLRKESSQSLAVDTGRFVGILTYETVIMPLTLSGRFGLRSEFTRKGLVAFGGIQIDPGFRGRLAISLFNAGPEPITLKYQRKMFTVEFNTLETEATKGYQGRFQNQNDFPTSQKQFILNATTASLSEIQSLPPQLASLDLRLARHENLHQLGQPPATLLEIAKAQGVKPLEDLHKLAGAWPEDEDLDEFLAAVRRWRGHQ